MIIYSRNSWKLPFWRFCIFVGFGLFMNKVKVCSVSINSNHEGELNGFNGTLFEGYILNNRRRLAALALILVCEVDYDLLGVLFKK